MNVAQFLLLLLLFLTKHYGSGILKTNRFYYVLCFLNNNYCTL